MFAGAHESALGDVVLAPGEPPETARKLLGALPDSGMQALDVFGLPGDSVLADGRRLAHACGAAGRVARDRHARRLGGRLQAPHELQAPQPGSPPRAPAGRARQPRGVARHDRRGRAARPARRLRAAPHALAGAARRLDLRPARGAALPAGGAAATRRRGPLRNAHAAARRAADRVPQLVRGRGARSTCIATPSTPTCRATGPGSWPCAAASPPPPSGVRDASSTWAAPSSSSATSRTASSPCTRRFGLARGVAGHAYVTRAQLAIALRKRLKRSERLHRLYLSGALSPRRNAPSS